MKTILKGQAVIMPIFFVLISIACLLSQIYSKESNLNLSMITISNVLLNVVLIINTNISSTRLTDLHNKFKETTNKLLTEEITEEDKETLIKSVNELNKLFKKIKILNVEATIFCIIALICFILLGLKIDYLKLNQLAFALLMASNLSCGLSVLLFEMYNRAFKGIFNITVNNL